MAICVAHRGIAQSVCQLEFPLSFLASNPDRFGLLACLLFVVSRVCAVLFVC